MLKNFYKNKSNSGLASPKSQGNEGGVTLIELIVVISIFLVMSLIVLFNYGQFRSATSIQNLADDIALSVRKAQSYAIGVRGSSSAFDFGYGVHFSLNSVTKNYFGSNKLFLIFANINNNMTYDYDKSNECGKPTAENECLEALKITSADVISNIYLGYSKDNEKAIDKNDLVEIFFNRPNPEPIFCYKKNTSSANDTTALPDDLPPIPPGCDQKDVIYYIKIEISNISDPNVLKIITIWNNGQISVT
ncbi:MAG: prepilin-type N-terminal cleavage/methylation domain-containing protein [Candidatus Paceibacterota bacterium]|jgi:prepilin-type N-terminal cleavage/methylation domain-containing protein